MYDSVPGCCCACKPYLFGVPWHDYDFLIQVLNKVGYFGFGSALNRALKSVNASTDAGDLFKPPTKVHLVWELEGGTSEFIC